MNVYVTSHGRRFHDPMRHIMTGSGQAHVTEKEAKAEGYEPCSYCFGTAPQRPALGRDPSSAYLRLHRKGRA